MSRVWETRMRAGNRKGIDRRDPWASLNDESRPSKCKTDDTSPIEYSDRVVDS